MTERPPFLPPALGLLMMLAIFSSHFIKPIAIVLPYPLNYIALLPIAFGVVLNILADREFRRKGLLNESGEYQNLDKILVTSGVYSVSRNPAYVGLVLIILGLALWVGSISPWLVVAAFPLILYQFYIRIEEQQLAAEFGDRYRQYTDLVPRWFSTKRKLAE